MTHTASLRIRFATAAEARRAERSLAPDNDAQVASLVEGPDLVLEAGSASILGLVRTLDDLLNCIRVLQGAKPPPKQG